MKKLILLVAIYLFASCSQSVSIDQYDKVVKTNNKLEQKIKELEVELNGFKFSPDKILSQANISYEQKDLDNLKALEIDILTYHPESKELKTIIGLKEKLVKELEAKAKLEEDKRLAAVTKLKKTYDDVSGITWYKQPYFTHYSNTNLFSLYIGQKKEGKPWLRLEMSYNGDDWIFFERAYLSVDGNTEEIPFNSYGEKKSDNSGGSVWEWIDVPVSDKILAFMKHNQDGKLFKMRLSGKYTKTRNLSPNEIKGLKDILLAYDVLLNEN